MEAVLTLAPEEGHFRGHVLKTHPQETEAGRRAAQRAADLALAAAAATVIQKFARRRIATNKVRFVPGQTDRNSRLSFQRFSQKMPCDCNHLYTMLTQSQTAAADWLL